MTPEQRKRWPWAKEMIGALRMPYGARPSAGRDAWVDSW